jgi:hypothetical protein
MYNGNQLYTNNQKKKRILQYAHKKKTSRTKNNQTNAVKGK